MREIALLIVQICTNWRGRGLVVLLLVVGAGEPAWATAYYVNPDGNDSNSGTSRATPWKTLAPVNARVFKAGDKILLAGGQTFVGPLTMNSSGTAGSPVVIASYGGGTATISGAYGMGTGDAIDSTNASYVTIQNLNLAGTSGAYGINFNATSGTQTGIVIQRVSVSGFQCGIYVLAWGGSFSGVQIAGTTVFNNAVFGIVIAGLNNDSVAGPSGNIANVLVETSTGYGNGLSSEAANIGAAVYLQGVYNGTVEQCTGYDNGDLGFWTFSCTNILFQYDTAYGNEGPDGGFDFDLATKNAVAQYNYTFNNTGEGFEMTAANGYPVTNATFRYNISENDGYPISIIADDTSQDYQGVYIYNNTVYSDAGNGVNSEEGALNLYTTSPAGVVAVNNIIYTASSEMPSLYWQEANLTLNYNDYYGPFLAIVTSPAATTDYNSLTAFQRATTFESKGVDENPQFVGVPGTLDSSAYELSPSSPILHAGVSLKSAYGIDPGTHDFFGNPIPKSGVSIGAYQ